MNAGKLALISSRFSFLQNPNRSLPISIPILRQWRSRHFQIANPSSPPPPLPNSTSPQVNSISAPTQNPNCIRLFTASFHAYITKQRSRNRAAHQIGIDSDELIEIVELIKRDENVESELSRKNLNFSHSVVSEILRVLNNGSISALRFFNWVLSSPSGVEPSPEIYNLIVDNLGRLGDFKTMVALLNELSLKKHCLTEKAFAFLASCRASDLRDLVGRVTVTLNNVSGSCRGSGIYSLIRVLSEMRSFDLAVFVMEEAGRRTSYYNVLVAAKCRNGDFQDARRVLDEMREFGCDPNMNSYNYLLGSLFKNKRVVEACDLMETMENMGYSPNAVTFEVVIAHACMTNKMDVATEFLYRMLSEGITPRLTTHAAFIKGYFWAGRLGDAHKYVTEVSMRDKGSVNMNYSLLARLFYESGRTIEAGGILHEMMEKGLKPNFPVYVKVVKELHKMTRGDLSAQLKSMFLKFIPSKEAG